MVRVLNIQLKPVIGNKEANLATVENFISSYSDKKLDLVVMPEFFSTGISHEVFVNSPEDTNGGDIVRKLGELAKEYNVNIIAGTVIEADSGKLYNTSFVINRDGETVAKYRKIHLYNYLGGTEGERITPGEDLVVADLDFGKVGLAVCYDIRYPLHYKKLVQKGAELIVLPTAWIVPAEIYNSPADLEYAKEMWIALNRTRAFDNMIYTVTSNQTGKINDNIGALGTSMIISPTGQVLAQADTDQCAFIADIDLSIVKYLKSIYPIALID